MTAKTRVKGGESAIQKGPTAPSRRSSRDRSAVERYVARPAEGSQMYVRLSRAGGAGRGGGGFTPFRLDTYGTQAPWLQAQRSACLRATVRVYCNVCDRPRGSSDRVVRANALLPAFVTLCNEQRARTKHLQPH